MDKNFIIFQMLCGDKSLSVGQSYDFQFPEKPTGLEAGVYDVQTEDFNYFDGSRVEKKKTKERPISATFDYVGFGDRTTIRDNVVRFFNPKITGKLFINYGGTLRYIEYEVVSLKDKQDNLHDRLTFHIELVCPAPYFKEIEEDEAVVATWIGGWKWRWSFPIKFRKRGDMRKIIDNEGDVPAPVRIEFRGPATNPKIIHHGTGQFVKINETITENDVIYIGSTEYEDNTIVELSRNDGQREDAFDRIDLDSEPFELSPGVNEIEFTCDDSEIAAQSVKISYRKRFLAT
ncbi:phage distal tail protein [Eubacterium aggregans]|uniref:phage distal tail protein n=1 Tax=Eubacterium aggregans TaxID=81409 RepID=UPI003F398C7B